LISRPVDDRRRALSVSESGILVFFAALYAIFIARTVFFHNGELVGTLFDDALISLRYAFNLYSGFGLVWNPGEVPPVEGYTNLLWTLIDSAAFLVAPVTTAPIVVSAIGAVVLLLSGYVAMQIARSVSDNAAVPLAAAILVLSCYPTVFWTLRGMEVGLASLFLLTATLLALNVPRDKAANGTLAVISTIAGLSFLARPDSILLYGPIFLTFAVPPRLSLRRLLAVTPVAACVGAQFAFRLYYYGESLPNTYILKMSGTPLAERLAYGLGALLFAVLAIYIVTAISVAAAASVRTSCKQKKLAFIVISVALIQSAYLIWIGGDAWAYDNSNRFIATVMPLLLVSAIASLPHAFTGTGVRRYGHAVFAVLALGLLAALTFTNFLPLGPRSNLLAVAGVVSLCVWPLIDGMATRAGSKRAPILTIAAGSLALFLVCSGPAWTRWLVLNATDVNDDIAFARQGLYLRDELPATATIASTWLGAPSYYSGLTSFDILGKTDKVVARMVPALSFRPGHNKFDLDYSIGKLQPDMVMVPGNDYSKYGYVPLRNSLWMRQAFFETVKNKSDVQESWCPSPRDSRYCPEVSR